MLMRYTYNISLYGRTSVLINLINYIIIDILLLITAILLKYIFNVIHAEDHFAYETNGRTYLTYRAKPSFHSDPVFHCPLPVLTAFWQPMHQ